MDKLRIGYEIDGHAGHGLGLYRRDRRNSRDAEDPGDPVAAMTRSKYRTERLKIPARDGTEGAPSRSSIRRTSPGTARASSISMPMAPMAMRSRPASRPAASRSSIAAIAFAIAHIRGGDDLGQQWYLDGKLEKRTNTFNDFVDVARGLIDRGFTHAGGIAIAGPLGGWRTDGRRGQFRSRAVGRGRRRRAVRRRAQHHARREPAAHARRMARMGQSGGRRGRVRTDPLVQPIRQRHRAGISAAVYLGRAQRSARDLLGTRRNGPPGCARPRPTTTSWSSRPIWVPAMAASPAGGKA